MNLWIIKGNGLSGKSGEREDVQVICDGLLDDLNTISLSQSCSETLGSRPMTGRGDSEWEAGSFAIPGSVSDAVTLGHWTLGGP